MSKTIHVRDIPNDIYYGLKQWQMKLRTTKWIDFFEKLETVLEEFEKVDAEAFKRVVNRTENDKKEGRGE